MGTPSPSNSDFKIVLFNCGSRTDSVKKKKKWTTEKIVKEPVRQKCVSEILSKLEPGDGKLFLLVQDEISGPIHELISQCVAKHTAKPVGPNIQDAEVFSFSKQHDMEYIDRDNLRDIYDKMKKEKHPEEPMGPRHAAPPSLPAQEQPQTSRPDTMDVQADESKFQVSRLSACVVTHVITKEKMLLVSWHGPSKIKDTEKLACLQTAIDFLKNLQHEKQCSRVLCGGDFNMPSENAKRILAEYAQLDGAVYSDYPLPEYLGASTIKDFFICWPARYFGQFDVEASVITVMEPIENPFGHPTIKFTLKTREPQVVVPGQNLDTEQSNERINALEREQAKDQREKKRLIAKNEELQERNACLEGQVNAQKVQESEERNKQAKAVGKAEPKKDKQAKAMGKAEPKEEDKQGKAEPKEEDKQAKAAGKAEPKKEDKQAKAAGKAEPKEEDKQGKAEPKEEDKQAKAAGKAEPMKEDKQAKAVGKAEPKKEDTQAQAEGKAETKKEDKQAMVKNKPRKK